MLSVIICTYNRAELLDETLKAMNNQTEAPDNYEILIIDNNCSDTTPDVVKKHQYNLPNLKCYFEKKVGLSHARNRGADEAKNNWLLYLDDDIIADKNLVKETIKTINSTNWDVIAGRYTQWFHYGEPKWYPKDWGTNKTELTDYGVLPENKFATGCIFAIKKSTLIKVGGFNPSYGMTGNNIGYGEETDVQVKIKNNGGLIGFNPVIKIKHIVPKHKLKLWWHLQAAWINEKAGVQIKKHGTNHYPFGKTSIRILKASIKRLKFAFKLTNKNYYIQNFIFDYSEPIIRLISGLYYSNFKKNV